MLDQNDSQAEKQFDTPSEIIAWREMEFENVILEASDCERYGCTCINYEKCCGCFIQ